jgi:biotin carboxyl carrier protein
VGAIVSEVARGAARGEFVVRDGDRVSRVFGVSSGGKVWIFHDGAVHEIAADAGRTRTAHAHGALTAPMPATVIRINCAPGDEVRKGDILLALEAMKMELPVRAPGDGRVTAVHCRPGDLVQPDVSLIDLE